MTDWRRMTVTFDLDPKSTSIEAPDRHELSCVCLGIVADAKSGSRGHHGGSSRKLRPGDGWPRRWDEALRGAPSTPRSGPIDTLRAVLPSDVPVFTDACEMGYRMHADWMAHGPRRRFRWIQYGGPSCWLGVPKLQ